VFRESLDVVSQLLLGEPGSDVRLLFLRGTRIFIEATVTRQKNSRQSEMDDVLRYAQSFTALVSKTLTCTDDDLVTLMSTPMGGTHTQRTYPKSCAIPISEECSLLDANDSPLHFTYHPERRCIHFLTQYNQQDMDQKRLKIRMPASFRSQA